ncbi:MAG: CAP domain-containing protein [Lachnospiraceae bacterium]|nr:CAP domain-containing protein [Lachnospiraceae bacterium]
MLWKKCVKNNFILLLTACLTFGAIAGNMGEQGSTQQLTSSAYRVEEIAVEEENSYDIATVAMAVRDKQTVSGNATGTVSGNTTEGNRLTADVLAVLEQINRERKAVGLAELVWDDELAAAADVRAKEITVSFSHTRPNGSEWWTVNEKAVYGENLAKGYQNAESVMKAWMDSPEHKDNILYPGFRKVGIAVYKFGEQWYWAQEFGY